MTLVTPSIEEFRLFFSRIRKNVLDLYLHSDLKVSTKFDETPVTEADTYIEKEIVSLLKSTGFPVISEEQKHKATKKKNVWYVDPLDGTQDFINHSGEFSIMIGLVEKTKPIFGLVYQPVNDKLFFAWKGKGAYLQIGNKKEKKLQIKENHDLAKIRAVVSRSHFLESDQEILDICGITKKIYCGSIGVKIGMILEGKADLFCNTSNKTFLWDTCAPQVLFKEAGGKFGGIDGVEIEYKPTHLMNKIGIFASNEVIYGQLLEKIHEKKFKNLILKSKKI